MRIHIIHYHILLFRTCQPSILWVPQIDERYQTHNFFHFWNPQRLNNTWHTFSSTILRRSSLEAAMACIIYPFSIKLIIFKHFNEKTNSLCCPLFKFPYGWSGYSSILLIASSYRLYLMRFLICILFLAISSSKQLNFPSLLTKVLINPDY